MTAETFRVDVDKTDGRKYIYQFIDEHDKNHGVDTMEPANQARIYETTGEEILKIM